MKIYKSFEEAVNSESTNHVETVYCQICNGFQGYANGNKISKNPICKACLLSFSAHKIIDDIQAQGDSQNSEQISFGYIEKLIDKVIDNKLNGLFNVKVGVYFAKDESGEEARRLGLPWYRNEGDAGCDLYAILAPEDREHGLTVFPNERKKIDTGIHLQMPPGIWGKIVHRSSTEKRHRLRIVEGTIDQGYRGPLFTQVANDNTFPITIRHGERYAQIEYRRIVSAEHYEIEDLGETSRGQRGFGSTGR